MIKKLVLTCLFFASMPKAQADTIDAMKCIGIAALATTGLYVGGRSYHTIIHCMAHKKYKPEIDLMARARFNDQVIDQELIPYILKNHKQSLRFFFFLTDTYRNYPLLKYKNKLDSYILHLWVFQLFHLGTKKRSKIAKTIRQLCELRHHIESDYRFIQERRSFEESKRHEKVQVMHG